MKKQIKVPSYEMSFHNCASFWLLKDLRSFPKMVSLYIIFNNSLLVLLKKEKKEIRHIKDSLLDATILIHNTFSCASLISRKSSFVFYF